MGRVIFIGHLPRSRSPVKRKPIILRLRNLPWRRVSRRTFSAMLQCQKLFRHIGAQPVTRMRWDEFRNKMESFLAFEYADLNLGFPEEPIPSLQKLIARAETLKNPARVFATEGIAYRLAKSDLERNSTSGCLASFQDCADFGPGILVLLHAGLGLALAESVLSSMDERESACSQLVEQFSKLCQQTALPSYEGVAFEALGFIAQALYPSLIEKIDQCLSANEDLLAYFWHGVGRGIYFSPENAFPFHSAPWRAVEMYLRQTPHELARQNAMAGLAWALIATNLSQPEIVASFLKHQAMEVRANIGFVSGVASAAIFWREVCPGEARLETLVQYDPTRIGLARDVWDQYVPGPWEDALGDRSLLKQGASPEELFRVTVEVSKQRKGA